MSYLMMNQTFSKSDYLQTLDWLIRYFPNAFSKKPKQIKPLKIGILEDIYSFYDSLHYPEVPRASIKQALQHYSASTIYLACQKENEARIDLYGQEVDVVNKEQAKYAQQRYEQKMAHRQQNPQVQEDQPEGSQS
jgi:ProP effector